MAKRGSVGSSLQGLKALAIALSAMKAGHVDLGFFAGDAARSPEGDKKAAARAKRVDEYIGAGSKPGFYKPGVDFAKKREAVKALPAAEELTNPEIAAKHEFGIGVPRRSMLRMPLHLYGDKVIKDAQADARVQLKQMARNPKGTAKKILARVGTAGENLVQEAFATGGFGSWKALSARTVAMKGSDAILIDSAQLRRAVDSRVVL